MLYYPYGSAWMRKEHEYSENNQGTVDQDHVIPLLKDLHPGKGKSLKEGAEIREALTYMINLLEVRKNAMERNTSGII